MRKPRLILVTSAFPYGMAETFLEAEIPFLSEKFDLTIAPMRKAVTSRVLPDNVSLDESLAMMFDKPRRKITSLFSFSFYSSLLHHAKNVTTLQAVKRLNTYNTEYRAVRRWLSSTIPKDCLLYTYWLNGATLAAAEYARQSHRGIKSVSRLHGYDAYTHLYDPPFFPYRKRVLRLIDRLFPISEAAAAELVKQGANSTKISISKLGVPDKDILTYASETVRDIARIVSVSNIYPVKRVDLIAQAVIGLARLRPSLTVEWIHLGGGHEKEKALAIIKMEKPPNLICQFTGWVSNFEVFKLYSLKTVDVFLNLSSSEGIPVSIMEALSCGIPVVATSVGGTGEIVLHRQNGYLLPPNPTVVEIVEGMQYTFDHFGKLDARKKIKLFWKKEYSAEKAYAEFCRQLQRLAVSSRQSNL